MLAVSWSGPRMALFGATFLNKDNFSEPSGSYEGRHQSHFQFRCCQFYCYVYRAWVPPAIHPATVASCIRTAHKIFFVATFSFFTSYSPGAMKANWKDPFTAHTVKIVWIIRNREKWRNWHKKVSFIMYRWFAFTLSSQKIWLWGL